jgi:hypothetical protein
LRTFKKLSFTTACTPLENITSCHAPSYTPIFNSITFKI